MEGCDGECVEVEVWCPECDRWQIHIRINDYCGECTCCGELNQCPREGCYD